MKTTGVIIAVALFAGCADPVATHDQSYVLKGTVLDSATSAPIEGAAVGIIRSLAEDSLLFLGDSLNASAVDSLALLWWTRTDGTFEEDWFLGMRDTAAYQYLFAQADGYRLWRYSRQPAAVRQVNAYTDDLTIRLVRK